MKCPHCKKETNLKFSNPELYMKKKIANAHASRAKAKANGTKFGRPKIRDDAAIRKLRSEGYSIRDIAHKVGVSPAAVQRGLKP